MLSVPEKKSQLKHPAYESVLLHCLTNCHFETLSDAKAKSRRFLSSCELYYDCSSGKKSGENVGISFLMRAEQQLWLGVARTSDLTRKTVVGSEEFLP